MEALTGIINSRTETLEPPTLSRIHLERLRESRESGEIDTSRLARKLASIFDEDTSKFLNNGGTFDLEQLKQLMGDGEVARLIQSLASNLNSENPDLHDNITLGSIELRENIVERNQMVAGSRLRQEFGVDADYFIGGDGSIDFEALRKFLEDQRVNIERIQNLELNPATIVDIET